MSRSRKKSPVHGVTIAESEKKDKKAWHSKLRHTVKQILSKVGFDNMEDVQLPLEKEVSDPWNMAKDGKVWVDSTDNNDSMNYMRK